MSNALAVQPPQTIADQKERRQLLRSLILRGGSEEQVNLILAICDRYGLDPMLKHIVLVSGNLYITRDGLLRIAHASGVLEAIEATAVRGDDKKWIATAQVWRSDKRRPFIFEAHQAEHENPGSGAWQKAPRAMTIKCAIVMALRHAFDVSLGAAEEIGYDGASERTNVGRVTIIGADARPVEDAPATAATLPAPAPKRDPKSFTDNQLIIFITDAAKPLERRRNAARELLSRAADFDALLGYYGALDQSLDQEHWKDLYDARVAELGGPAPADDPPFDGAIETTAVEAPAEPPTEPNGGAPATERQVRFIHAIARESKLDAQELAAWLQEAYGTSEPGQLNRRDAAEVIEALQRRRNEIA